MQHIVVGVTETETSQMAARRAVEVAHAVGATVHFVTAIREAENSIVRVAGDEWELNTIEEARTKIASFVHDMALDVTYTVEALEGDPSEVLLEAARRLHADLIVVGNVRMQGIGRVLGSVGNEVLRQAPCDVLIVKTV